MEDVSIIKIGDKIIVPIQCELNDIAAKRLQDSILERIGAVNARGLIIDVSELAIVDSFMGRLLVDTAKMAKLMGTETVLTGLRKEVVLTLIQLGLILKDINSALNIEDGIHLLNKMTGNKNEQFSNHEN